MKRKSPVSIVSFGGLGAVRGAFALVGGAATLLSL